MKQHSVVHLAAHINDSSHCVCVCWDCMHMCDTLSDCALTAGASEMLFPKPCTSLCSRAPVFQSVRMDVKRQVFFHISVSWGHIAVCSAEKYMKWTVSLSLHHLRCKIPSKSERHRELGRGDGGREGKGVLNRDKKERKNPTFFHYVLFCLEVALCLVKSLTSIHLS